MKPAIKVRRALVVAFLAGTTGASTGCSSGGFSLASVNPFSKPSPTIGLGSKPGFSNSLASTASGTKTQLASFGSSAKNAFAKTTGAVTGVFKRGDKIAPEGGATDPLSLSNKPAKVGAEVHVASGHLWESMREPSKAMESYARALESEPNDTTALASIARLHFRQGNHKKAAEYFQQAISQAPNDAVLYNDLGLTLNKLGDNTGAIQSLNKALEMAPGTSRYANALASVQFETGDSASAYQALLSNNKPAVAHYNMAFLHSQKGQISDARGHLEQALQFESQSSEDVAVKRAVDRSRSLLAQIDASMNPNAQAPIAQARIPQARIAQARIAQAPIVQASPAAPIAGSQFLKQRPVVQQTSQQGTPNAGVTPAASTVPTQPSFQTDEGPSMPFSMPNFPPASN